MEFLEHIDRILFLFINSKHNAFFDAVMWFISGIYSWVPLYLALIVFIIIKFRKDSWLIILFILALLILTDQSSVKLFKEVFQRYRPCHNLELKGIVHIVNNKCGGTYGFVSSHASNVFGLATFLSLLFKKKYISISLFLWASVIGYSRIYLGVHYPGDVICGSMLGLFWALVLFFLFKKTATIVT